LLLLLSIHPNPYETGIEKKTSTATPTSGDIVILFERKIRYFKEHKKAGDRSNVTASGGEALKILKKLPSISIRLSRQAKKSNLFWNYHLYVLLTC